MSEHHIILQERRREQKTPEFQKKTWQRNAIEDPQSELVRAHELRQARYRGIKKVRLQNRFAGAACNAKRRSKRVVWEARNQRGSLEPGMLSGRKKGAAPNSSDWLSPALRARPRR